MQLVGTCGREHLSVPPGVEVVFVRRRGKGGLGDDDPAQYANLAVLPVRVGVVRAARVAGRVHEWREAEHQVGALVADAGSRGGTGRVEGREGRGAPHGLLGGPQAEGGEFEGERVLVTLVCIMDGVLTAE